MPMEVFFLNSSVIQAKSGKVYHKLTVAQADGEVIEFFEEDSVEIPALPLFTPMSITVSIKPIGNNVRLGLISIDKYDLKGGK